MVVLAVIYDEMAPTAPPWCFQVQRGIELGHHLDRVKRNRLTLVAFGGFGQEHRHVKSDAVVRVG